MHRRRRIDRGDFDPAVRVFCTITLQGNITPMLSSADKRLKRQTRIAGAQDAVGPKILVDLRLEGLRDVDLRQHAEALDFQRFRDAGDTFVESAFDMREM